MRAKVRSVVVAINPTKGYAQEMGKELESILKAASVRARSVPMPKVNTALDLKPIALRGEDMIIVGGGDGTLLRAARLTRGSGVPLLGINLGSLGFLTSIPHHEIHVALPRALAGDYVVSKRMALQFRVQRGGKTMKEGWALNDVVVTRGSHGHMIRLTVEVGDELLTQFHCDGLIFATPTGSTAYSLSAGGPIISPQASAFSITPICAHTLSNRPLIVAAREPMHFVVPENSPPVVLQSDGVTHLKLQPKDRVKIFAAKEPALLAHLPEASFYNIVRQKLRWSGASTKG
ncbi:MAG: NAD(+)/NADH kinase [bacterium]